MLAALFQLALSDSPIRLVLGGVCIGIALSTFVVAEILRHSRRGGQR
jgi:hypothetical protein